MGSIPPELKEVRPIDPRLRILFKTIIAFIFISYIGFDFINRGIKIKNANETIISCSVHSTTNFFLANQKISQPHLLNLLS